MEEHDNGTSAGAPPEGSRKRGNLFWLLVILAVVLVWWWWKSPKDNGTSSNAAVATDPAALADADPDDILVDLRDRASDADVARLEAELGIDLVLISDQSADERLYRAHVAPDRRDAILAELSRRPDVEIAEPDAEMTINWEGFPND